MVYPGRYREEGRGRYTQGSSTQHVPPPCIAHVPLYAELSLLLPGSRGGSLCRGFLLSSGSQGGSLGRFDLKNKIKGS